MHLAGKVNDMSRVAGECDVDKNMYPKGTSWLKKKKYQHPKLKHIAKEPYSYSKEQVKRTREKAERIYKALDEGIEDAILGKKILVNGDFPANKQYGRGEIVEDIKKYSGASGLWSSMDFQIDYTKGSGNQAGWRSYFGHLKTGTEAELTPFINALETAKNVDKKNTVLISSHSSTLHAFCMKLASGKMDKGHFSSGLKMKINNRDVLFYTPDNKNFKKSFGRSGSKWKIGNAQLIRFKVKVEFELVGGKHRVKQVHFEIFRNRIPETMPQQNSRATQ